MDQRHYFLLFIWILVQSQQISIFQLIILFNQPHLVACFHFRQQHFDFMNMKRELKKVKKEDYLIFHYLDMKIKDHNWKVKGYLRYYFKFSFHLSCCLRCFILKQKQFNLQRPLLYFSSSSQQYLIQQYQYHMYFSID